MTDNKNILINQDILGFMKRFTDASFQVYIVGGAVRDLIQDRLVSDWDFTTSAIPEQIQALFPNSYYNNTYGTVTVKYEVDGQELLLEVTPFRKEGTYSDGRRPDEVIWAKTLQEDLARRDFTINAMAHDGSQIIDPFHGLNDLKIKVIRAVGDPAMRFAEDALRLIRAIRLSSQLGFTIEEGTRLAIISTSLGIKNVSWERIKIEFFKILESDYPSDGILLLKNTGLLQYVLPEVEVCFVIPQKSPKRHHIYDVGTHLVMSLKHCNSKNPVTRLATLIHDIGKERTFHKDESTGLITFFNHEVVGAHMAEKIAKRFRLSTEEKDLLIRLVANHQFVVSEELTDNAIRRFIRNVGKENLEEMFELRRADRLGGAASETSWRTELFKKRVAELLIEPFTVKDLKINGTDVMKILNLKPSKKVGDILDDLFAKVENKELPNDRETLIATLSNLSLDK